MISRLLYSICLLLCIYTLICLYWCLYIPAHAGQWCRYQGEAEVAIQRVFSSAHRHAPSLILLDDVDILCANRADTSGGGHGVGDLRKRIVSCLLTLIEGVQESQPNTRNSTNTSSSSSNDMHSSMIPTVGAGRGMSNGQIFLIATSSCPRDIDPAMRRPGRLDREIELEVPSPHDRELILMALLRAMCVPIIATTPTGAARRSRDGRNQQEDVTSQLTEQVCEGGPGDIQACDEAAAGEGVTLSCVQEVAQRAHGMVGADLLLVCKEACLLAVERRVSSNGILDITANTRTRTGAPTTTTTDVSISKNKYGSMSAPPAEPLLKPTNLADDLDFSDLSLDEKLPPAAGSPPFPSSLLAAGDVPMHTASRHAEKPEIGTPAAAADGSMHVTDRDLLLAATKVRPSAVREVSVEVPKVRWMDIGGMDDVKQSLQEVRT